MKNDLFFRKRMECEVRLKKIPLEIVLKKLKESKGIRRRLKKCPWCQYIYKQKSEETRHFLNHHPVESQLKPQHPCSICTLPWQVLKLLLKLEFVYRFLSLIPQKNRLEKCRLKVKSFFENIDFVEVMDQKVPKTLKITIMAENACFLVLFSP